MRRDIEQIDVDGITVPPRARPLDSNAVKTLMQSIEKIGLRTPITVRGNSADEFSEVYLVSGHHRLEACKMLGMETIDAFVAEDVSEDQARLWEIAENLHRAELTALERDEHVAEWIRLSDKVSESKMGRPGLAAAAARELNVNERGVQRAVKVDSLTQEAKEAAREVGLDDNRSALLEAAREAPERQAARIIEIAEHKAIQKDDPPDMRVVAHGLGRKYTIGELQALIDALTDILKEKMGE